MDQKPASTSEALKYMSSEHYRNKTPSPINMVKNMGSLIMNPEWITKKFIREKDAVKYQQQLIQKGLTQTSMYLDRNSKKWHVKYTF